MDNVTKIILIAAPIGFIAIWSIVVALIGLAGGWYSLAKKLEKPVELGSRTMEFTMASLSMGLFTKYNGVVNIYFHKNGFICKPIIFFRIMHPQIKILWGDIQSLEHGKVFITDYVDVYLKHKKIRMFGPAANYLSEQYDMDKKG